MGHHIRLAAAAALLAALVTTMAVAGEVEVVSATARQGADGAYQFSVTLRHADTGWDHYADKWDVVAPDGTVLGTRVLVHPHQDEQPFTRGLSGIRVPKGAPSGSAYAPTTRCTDTPTGP
jgi:hypothetical protein